MVVFDTLPPEIEAQWLELKSPGEETLLVAMSDIRHDGRFGVRWILLTDSRVVVLPHLAPGVDGAVSMDLSEIPMPALNRSWVAAALRSIGRAILRLSSSIQVPSAPSSPRLPAASSSLPRTSRLP